jgi:hypothetical protein
MKYDMKIKEKVEVNGMKLVNGNGLISNILLDFEC